jgi:hypothetical protein
MTQDLRNARTSATVFLSETRARTRSRITWWSMLSKEAPTHYPYRGPCGGGVLGWRPREATIDVAAVAVG